MDKGAEPGTTAPEGTGKKGKAKSGTTPYRCQICMKEFFWGGSLRRHLRIHSGEKPFSCTVCGKRFTQSGTLNRHSRTHTGKQLFLCRYCPRQFNSNNNLNQHYLCHEQNGATIKSMDRCTITVGDEEIGLSPLSSDVDMMPTLAAWESRTSKFRLDNLIATGETTGAGGDHVPSSTTFTFDAHLASRLEEPVNLDIATGEIESEISSQDMTMLLSTSSLLCAFLTPGSPQQPGESVGIPDKV